MKILLTGGHFSPAYTIIKELTKRGNSVAIAGRKYTFEGENIEAFEYEVSRKEDIPFFEIKTGRLQRKFTKYTIFSIFKIISGFYDSFKILLKFKPDIVLTFGGYIGFPIAYASFMLGIPVVLHEQTQKAGLSGKAISWIASRICISYESSQKYFNQRKTTFTGNPIRDEIFKTNKKIPVEKGYKIVYITGGSSGSHFLNQLIPKILLKLLKDFTVILQSGDNVSFNDYEELEKVKRDLPLELKRRYILKKFVYPEEIGNIFEISDIVVSRAGINTVGELLALGKVSLLIPLPHGQKGEQLENANLIKDAGIGDFIEEKDADPETVYLKIKEMIEKRSEYEKNKSRLQSLIPKDAAVKILNVIKEVYFEKIEQKKA
ncbi:MAG: hypothetical protein A3C27_03860 [Candidatus Levybacteria bacterium RIFCSPHIGHO2_02_FULL_39_36]|nr:MAG: hypothetical protein UT20_C0017G0007 [Candidatus Levybacteria bacterium GW2011_GWA1_39_11]KKR24840.1 MAG: hypothetical protein UT56_C0007G0008 [Candidatus Levybacteria bacterium GW2011_GWB1_39_7]KKR26616.1 MAG: hypothetical protein UT57_C0030G0003 [Microgenomates group bacterium GW2011_GWC1_39_7]KKR50081.1 MAG: hypothetical protein UT85_C0006G0010 [Candidatus Levybacteria bacterium GW2011_GWA2_40_16]OGH15460.1 MAG: hypothetical protein A2689_02005 [Candidatus Levybacteria bacterium RIFC